MVDKKINVELTQDEARALLSSQPERGNKDVRSLDSAQSKVAQAMLETNHGR